MIEYILYIIGSVITIFGITGIINEVVKASLFSTVVIVTATNNIARILKDKDCDLNNSETFTFTFTIFHPMWVTMLGSIIIIGTHGLFS